MPRKIKSIRKAEPVLEGAGVHLKRAFGYHQLPDYDPFLMLDDFRNDDPDKYLPGFPWHPHRGIETITTCWKVLLSMVTAWGIMVRSTKEKCSG